MAKTSDSKQKQVLYPLFRAENLLLAEHLYATPDQDEHLFTTPHFGGCRIFVALDEVGRGCVAGPVVVCATLWVAGQPSASFKDWSTAVRDSKKMSSAQREKSFTDAVRNGHFIAQPHWDEPPCVKESANADSVLEQMRRLSRPSLVKSFTAEQLKANLQAPTQGVETQEYKLTCVFIGSVNATEIDRHGIIPALGLAASRALEQIPQDKTPSVLFFDGHRPLSLFSRWTHTPQILVTKGDDLLKSISISSVIAKVVRDRWMVRYGVEYPQYDFAAHRGYGTDKHQKFIKKHGLTQIHRRSFLKNICPESPA